MKKLIVILSVLLVVLALALGGVYVAAQVRSDVMPTVPEASMEDYATNMINSLLNDDEIEIPDGLISSILDDETEDKTVCRVNDSNELELWTNHELPVLGKADLCIKLSLESYDQESGKLSFAIGDISAGSMTVPEFLKPMVIEAVEKEVGDSISIEGGTVSAVIPPFSVNFMHMDISIGISEIAIHDGSVWFSLYTNTDFSF